MKKIIASTMFATTIALTPAVAFAHVIVTPAQVNVGQDTTFQMNVPNEKNDAVTSLRLVMPNGLDEVSPYVKDGWTVNTVKKGDAITEIDWTGGSIPVGEGDTFLFGGQPPANAGELDWKAYQTYADGTVVSWNQKPTGSDSDALTPYSVTKVINDLASTPTTTTKSSSSNTGVILGTVAIVLALASLLIKRGK